MSEVKNLRKENNMTQFEVSDILGISVPNYSKKENGIVKFSLQEAEKLSILFNKSIEDIFFATKFQNKKL